MFNFFGLDKKNIIIILAIMLGIWLFTTGTEGILNILFIIPGVLIALTFHEYAHAFAAYKLGDDTAKEQGRLSLNPITHIDPIGFIFLLVAGFGWGKPVEIDSRNFNGKYSLSKAEAIVAAAGPIMNFILAFILLIIYYLLFTVFNITEYLNQNLAFAIYMIVNYSISINIGLGVFNLIPLPPLDGSKILFHFLPSKGKEWFYSNEHIFYIIFLLIWITGLASKLLNPIFSIVLDGMNWVVLKLFGLFM